MRKYLFVILVVLFSVSVQAQDKIMFIGRPEVEAIVETIGESVITYRMYSNPYGPIYSAEIKDVSRILFENGEVQNFAHAGTVMAVSSIKGPIIYSRGKIYMGEKSFNGRAQALNALAYSSDPEYYMKLYTGGSLMQGFGIGLTASGVLPFLSGATVGVLMSLIGEKMTEAQLVYLVGGAACLTAGIPLIIFGKKKLKKLASDFNSEMGLASEANVTIGACPNGFGIALNF